MTDASSSYTVKKKKKGYHYSLSMAYAYQLIWKVLILKL